MSNVFDPYHRWLGISPKDQPPNHYRLLGIDLLEADPEVIRDAAEQRMAHVRTYHLGQYGELSQRILNELAAAKACLLDPQKKAAYDAGLRGRQGGPPGKTPPLPETADEYAVQRPAATSPDPPHIGPGRRVVASRPALPVGKFRRKRQLSPLWAAAAGVMLVVVVVGFAVAWRHGDMQARSKGTVPFSSNENWDSPRKSDAKPPRCPSLYHLNRRSRLRDRPRAGRPKEAVGMRQLHHRRRPSGNPHQRRLP